VADWVAISSVVSSASVAIAVPFITARNERKRYEQQSLDARRDELRQLFDSSIQHLFKGYDVLYSIGRESVEHRAGRSSMDRLRALGRQLQNETWLIAQHGLRVGLRVPAGASLAQKQTEVNRIFLHYAFEYDNYLKANPADASALPPSPHKEAFAGIRDFREEIRAFLGVVPPLELPTRSPQHAQATEAAIEAPPS